jgi:hypothetical protein
MHRSMWAKHRLIPSLVIAIASAVIGCAKGAQPEDVQSPPPLETVAQEPSARPTSALPSGVSLPPVKVYKDANCGCCVKWIEHLQQNGFKVEAMDMPDMSLVKQKYGVKPEMQACHTAVIGDYVVEGHVPADVIMKMLREKPAIAGLAVPGMPAGSPGMEGAMKERYDVLTFDRAGHSTVYAER